jgi:hypothetical protein
VIPAKPRRDYAASCVASELPLRALPSTAASLSRTHALAPGEVPATVRAVVVDALRVVAGGLLSLHYAQHLRLTTAVLDGYGLWQALPSGPDEAFATWTAPLLRLAAGAAPVWFGAGVILSVLLAIGVAPRVCAILLVGLGATTYRALLPAVTFDDWFAEAIPFWMLLLPAGRTLAPGTWKARRGWNEQRNATWALLACLVFFLIFMLQVSLSSPSLPGLGRLAFFAAAGLALAPIGAWRLLALPTMAVGLWYLASLEGSLLGCGFSAAMCGAFLALLLDGPRDRAGGDRRSTFTAAAAIGWCACGLLALHTVAALAGSRDLTRSTGTTLANVGLGRLWAEPADDGASPAVAFVADGDGGVRLDPIDPSNPRLGRLLRFVVAEEPDLQPLRALLIRRLVAHHCDTSGAESDGRPEHLVVQRGDGSQDRVAWLQCERPGEEAKVVDLRPLAGAPGDHPVDATDSTLP